MRIFEIITPSRIGGAETHFVTTIQQLRAQGDDVMAFCPTGRPLIDLLYCRGITPVSWRTAGKIDPRTVYRFASFITARHIDIVHTHLSTGSLLGSLAARIAGVPCVATVHGLNHAYWYRFCDRLIAVSSAVKQHLMRQQVAERRICLIHNGIPIDRYRPIDTARAKHAVGFDAEHPRIGVIGRLSPEKGHAVAFHAFRQVLHSFPGARLMLMGDGKLRDELRALAATLHMEESVEFFGFVDDPRLFTNACDIILVPSMKEGFSLAAIEAMAMRRPVIAAAVGGLLDIIEHDVSGLLVPVGDADALAVAMHALLQDPSKRQQLGDAGRERVLGHFDAASHIDPLRQMMQQLTARQVTLLPNETRS